MNVSSQLIRDIDARERIRRAHSLRSVVVGVLLACMICRASHGSENSSTTEYNVVNRYTPFLRITAGQVGYRPNQTKPIWLEAGRFEIGRRLAGTISIVRWYSYDFAGGSSFKEQSWSVLGVTYRPFSSYGYVEKKPGKNAPPSWVKHVSLFVETYPYRRFKTGSTVSEDNFGSLRGGLRIGAGLVFFGVELEAAYETYEGWIVPGVPRSETSGRQGFYLSINLTGLDLHFVKKRAIRVPTYRKPKLPPFLALDLQFSDANRNGSLDASEPASIEGWLINKGEGKAVNVKLEVSSTNDQGITLPSEVALGDIESGERKEIAFSIIASDQLPDGSNTLTISAIEQFGHNASQTITVPTVAFKPPRLELVQTTIDDDQMGDSYGNANSKIEPGELIETISTIRNAGVGIAKDVCVSLQYNPTSVFIQGGAEFNLGDILPGESRQIAYVFSVNKRYSGSEAVPITLKAIEAKGRYGFETNPGLKLYQLAAGAQYAESPISQGDQESTTLQLGGVDNVDTDIPRGKTEKRDAVAVVICNFRYNSKDIPPVLYAQRDAAIMKEYLVKTLGYSEANIFYVENPTKSELEALFGTESDARGKIYNRIIPGKSELFVYYSGHGAPDVESGKSYFVPADCDPTLVRLGGYAVETFYNNLSLLATTKTWVVIDACFSGAYQEGTLISGASPIYVQLESSEKLLKNGTVFSSAKGDQIASWYPEKKHGLFTYFFLKGLQRAADSDADKKITVGEMEQYLTDNVNGVPYYARRLWQREQVPVVTSGDKTEVLVELK